MWVLWKIRNDICFNRNVWLGMQVIWRKLSYFLSQWLILLSGAAKDSMVVMMEKVEQLAHGPPLLTWPNPG